MNIRRFFLPLLFALPVAGCSSLLNVQRQPFTIYSPNLDAAATPAAGPRVDWQLAVETPLASDVLDSARIAVMPTPGVLEVFPAARWRDPAPALLRSLVVQGFENSGRIVGVGSAASGLRADYALSIGLHDFQLELRAGTPHAVVRFQAQVRDYTSNRVLATRAFAEDAPAAGTDAGNAFAAFEVALNKIIPELVDWTLREGEAAHTKAPGA
ncbi:ABC-type transport auxiliary lipoprotein family protein [Dokdonella soli]|uniref:ABC-type transport auxiliary lipoprotein family protein n=1 Tax=Dokdonella soli TaxID=529810 RepID=A0ABN1ICW2_9GAMM